MNKEEDIDTPVQQTLNTVVSNSLSDDGDKNPTVSFNTLTGKLIN